MDKERAHAKADFQASAQGVEKSQQDKELARRRVVDAVKKNELASQQLDNAACESDFSHERVIGAAREK